MTYNLYHVHDPMCSWCYAFRPTLKKLRENLPSNVKIINVVGGLAKHSDEPMPKEMQEKIETIWYEIEQRVGTKFNHNFWKDCIPRRSTYLACQATILARYENKEEEMIEAIQEAYYQRAMNPSDISTLVLLAKEIGIDDKKFEEDLKSQNIEDELQNELNFRRSLNCRSFPSLIFKENDKIYNINITFNEHESMLKEINELIFTFN